MTMTITCYITFQVHVLQGWWVPRCPVIVYLAIQSTLPLGWSQQEKASLMFLDSHLKGWSEIIVRRLDHFYKWCFLMNPIVTIIFTAPYHRSIYFMPPPLPNYNTFTFILHLQCMLMALHQKCMYASEIYVCIHCIWGEIFSISPTPD